MRLSFRNKGLHSFDAAAVALEATSLADQQTGRIDGGGSPMEIRLLSLDLSRNRIHTFMGAKFLPHLEHLDLSDNALRSAMNLPMSVTKLDLSRNALESLVGLDTLYHLVVLDVSSNRVADVGRLPGSLQVLNLAGNLVSDCEGLSHLIRVTKLQLHDNRLKLLASVATLGSLKALRHLTISGNPVTANAKLVPLLESDISKLTTLDGLPLSQARTNAKYRAIQRKADADATHQRVAAAKIARFQADREGSLDAVVEQELRGLEARVRELESIAKVQYEAEVKERRELGITRQQLHRAQEVMDEQGRALQELQSVMQRDQSTVDSLERTLESLAKAFEQQHALIVMKKLERGVGTASGERGGREGSLSSPR